MARIRKSTEQTAAKGQCPAWRIALYIRLSREDGEEESLSIVNQRKIIAEYLDESFDGEYVIVDAYIDDGITGTDYDRPAFQRMMRDIETGAVNCVICKTLSRAFRNYADQGYFLENFFPRYQTRFISIGGPHVDSFTNPDAINGLEVPITGLLNDRYAGKTSEDVRRTFNTKRRKGEYIGAFAPYGYEKDPQDKNRLLVDADAAQTVRDVFHWFVRDGLSILGIARRLNEQGVPNPSAYKRGKGFAYTNPNAHQNDGLWSATTIRRLLANPLYLGHMVQGKQRVISYKVHDRVSVPKDQWFVKEDTHEAIVSRELFDMAQGLLQRDTRSADGRKAVYLLSGYVRCADCGKAMHRHPAKEIAYYVCRTYQQKSKLHCTKHTIREDALEGALRAAVRAQVALVPQLSEAIDALSEAPAMPQAQRFEALLKSRKQEAERIRKAASALYVDWKNGEITRDEYRQMKSDLEAQQARLQAVIENLEEETHRAETSVGDDPAPIAALRSEGNIERLDRGILAALLDIALVHEGKQVTVRFRHADPFAFSPDLG